MTSQPKYECKRCGFVDNDERIFLTGICGSCADDLRQEDEAGRPSSWEELPQGDSGDF